jgi:putative RecB family exonuclease
MSTGLLDRQTLPRRDSGVWSYISASRLSLWLRCALAFRFRYVDGIQTPTTPSLFLGKTVHAGLQVYYRHRQLGLTLAASDVHRRLLESWDQATGEASMQFECAADEQALQKQTQDLLTAYIGQVPVDEPRPLAVEATMEAPLVDPLTGESLGIPLLGIVDLILDGQEGPVIADFKTAARSSDPLEITHEIQLSSYAWLFRQIEQRQEAGLEIRSLIKTKAPKIEFHAYPARTDTHFRRLFSVIREYLDALDCGRFNYRPGFGCAMCEHHGGLCHGWCG